MVCDDFPILRPGDSSPHKASQCSDPAAAAIYSEIADSVVMIKVGGVLNAGYATGFFVGNGDEIVTNAHVVEDELNPPMITTRDGGDYQSHLEAIDQANDLAVLKVLGMKHNYKPLHFRPSSSLSYDEPLFGLGHPQGRHDVYISPGTYQGHGPYLSWINQTDHFLAAKIKESMRSSSSSSSSDQQVAEQRNEEFNSERVADKTEMQSGNSGSPVVDGHGLVVSVFADRDPDGENAFGLGIPSEKAASLLQAADPHSATHIQNFVYERKSKIVYHPIWTALKEGLIGGSALLFDKAGMSVSGCVTLLKMPFDIENLLEAKTDPRISPFDRAVDVAQVAADATILSGIACALIPATRKLCMPVYMLGIGTAVTADALTRKDRLANPLPKFG